MHVTQTNPVGILLFLMQKLSFVLINLLSCCPREWKRFLQLKEYVKSLFLHVAEIYTLIQDEVSVFLAFLAWTYVLVLAITRSQTSLRRRNLKTEVSLWNPHYGRKIWKPNNHRHFRFVFEKNHTIPLFAKSSDSKITVSVHTKTQSWRVFKFLRFKEQFWKAPFVVVDFCALPLNSVDGV